MLLSISHPIDTLDAILDSCTTTKFRHPFTYKRENIRHKKFLDGFMMVPTKTLFNSERSQVQNKAHAIYVQQDCALVSPLLSTISLYM